MRGRFIGVARVVGGRGAAGALPGGRRGRFFARWRLALLGGAHADAAVLFARLCRDRCCRWRWCDRGVVVEGRYELVDAVFARVAAFEAEFELADDSALWKKER